MSDTTHNLNARIAALLALPPSKISVPERARTIAEAEALRDALDADDDVAIEMMSATLNA